MHIAIIAEYNPFHSGHAYQIEQVRKAFGKEACITVILGGIFSQRGAPYIAPPYVRAEAAVACGADLVLELPFPFSCAPAGIFARAGVEIAAKIGANILAFGSESGDLAALETKRRRLDSDEFREALAAAKDETVSKTRLYTRVYEEVYGEAAPKMPNDILAIEYLRAIEQSGAALRPYTVLRKGDYKSGEGGFASASVLRDAYAAHGLKALQSGMPEAAYAVLETAEREGLLAPDYEKLAGAVLLKFAEGKGDVAFALGGLSGHIAKAAKTAKNIAALLDAASTARYTDAEIARCILYTLLSVRTEDMDAPVLYTRVLAMGERGRAVLAEKHAIEILTKPSAVQKLSAAARAQYVKTFYAERAYAITLSGDYDHLKQTPRIL